MRPRDKRPLTLREMQTLYAAAQSHLGGSRRVGTLQRAMGKLSFQMGDSRRKAIFDHGKRDAKAKRPASSQYGGHHLGSLESVTYYDGFASIDKDFVNPYRRSF